MKYVSISILILADCVLRVWRKAEVMCCIKRPAGL